MPCGKESKDPVQVVTVFPIFNSFYYIHLSLDYFIYLSMQLTIHYCHCC